MGGFTRAFGRLLVMGAVMAAVLVTCLVAGVGTTIAVALAVVLAGLVGLVGVGRRVREATDAAVPGGRTPAPDLPRDPSASTSAAIDAMNPASTTVVDPESLMPRWRRPSLLEARRADPTRAGAKPHTPLRFGGSRAPGADLRVVRYAVATVRDRPDDVLGTRLTDLIAGDEVEIVGASGAFLEVICPSGEHGWIHRTTVGHAVPAPTTGPRGEPSADAEDALSALLAARGLQ